MGFLSDVKRGAKAVAKEAETQTQLALKHAEAANLESAIREALAEAGREMLVAYAGDGTTVPLNDRARALFDEARRLETELAVLRSEMDKLRESSVLRRKEKGE